MADKKKKEKLERSLERPGFRILLVDDDGFSEHLRILPAFIKNLSGRSLRKCTLRGPGGKSWIVKLEQKRGGLFFHDGWPDFARDNFIELEDFLVFEYDGVSEFEVTVYDKTCCEKNAKAANGGSGNLSEGSSGDDLMYEERPACDHLGETSTRSIIFKSERTCFKTTQKPYNRCYVSIPKVLAIAEGLVSAEGSIIKETLILQDSAGRSFHAYLNVLSDGRAVMRRGWPKCRSTNEISDGDTIVFEFVGHGVMQVHIFRGDGCSVVLPSDVYNSSRETANIL